MARPIHEPAVDVHGAGLAERPGLGRVHAPARAARSTGSPSVADMPECTDCGVCCFSTQREHVRVFGVDLERMDGRALAHVDSVNDACFMRLEQDHCAALIVDPSANRFSCAIYAVRPDVCRSLERGSGACRSERREKGEWQSELVRRARTHVAGVSAPFAIAVSDPAVDAPKTTVVNPSAPASRFRLRRM